MKQTVFVLFCWLPQMIFAGGAGDDTFLYGYFAGHYLVVGKALDSGKTYTGKVVFEAQEDHLIVTRKINGDETKGVGTIEHALGGDEVDVLRVRFTTQGEEFEITYLWQSDLDNYPRLTGYLYQPNKKTDSPGLEALFIDHSAD